MLVFSRKLEEGFVINLEGLLALSDERLREVLSEDITVTVVDLRHDKARLGITAPKEVAVHRDEVWEAILSKREVPA